MSPAIADFIAQLVILLPAFIAGLSIHEFFHAFVAYICGDDTAEKMGRMTLNPMEHIDFLGLFCFILFKFGWAKPVLVNKRNFKYPKIYDMLVSLAGPFSNFLLALVFLYITKYFPWHLCQPAVALSISQMFNAMISVNIMFGVFNLLPIPPLDGSHLITGLLSDIFPNFVFRIYENANTIFLLFLFALSLVPQLSIFLTRLIIMAEILLRSLVF